MFADDLPTILEVGTVLLALLTATVLAIRYSIRHDDVLYGGFIEPDRQSDGPSDAEVAMARLLQIAKDIETDRAGHASK
jgi:hypothetical protein